MSECKTDGQPSMGTEEPVAGFQYCFAFNGCVSCTLEKGHSGDHVAHGYENRVLATWPQEKIIFPGESPELDALLLKAQDLAEAMRKHNLTHLGQLQLR